MASIKIHNPDGLPTINFRKLVDFQGDLKRPISKNAIEKLKNSLKRHGVFVPKFVWVDESGAPNILDGHQTRQALESLAAEGFEIPEIPFVRVVAENRIDAAEKLLQLNSRYAEFNPDSEWLQSLPDLSDLLDAVAIPELSGIDKEEKDDEEKAELAVELKTQDLTPVRKIHILISVDVNKYVDLLPFIEPLQTVDFIEYRQSGN